MPSTTPIYSALQIVRRSLGSALAPLVGTYQGGPARYWRAPRQGSIPALKAGDLAGLLVYQSQDAGGDQVEYIGEAGWSGQWLIRAHATTQDAAEALIATVPAALVALSAPTGYAVTARFLRPREVPTVDEIYGAGHLYELSISHTTGA